MKQYQYMGQQVLSEAVLFLCFLKTPFLFQDCKTNLQVKMWCTSSVPPTIIIFLKNHI